MTWGTEKGDGETEQIRKMLQRQKSQDYWILVPAECGLVGVYRRSEWRLEDIIH